MSCKDSVEVSETPFPWLPLLLTHYIARVHLSRLGNKGRYKLLTRVFSHTITSESDLKEARKERAMR